MAIDNVQQELFRQTGKTSRAVVTDNNEPKGSGHHTSKEEVAREVVLKISHCPPAKLASFELERPMQSDMKCNDHGHIHMES